MSFFDDDTAQPEEDFDRIEVDMTIKASVEDVWGIVAEPGWWVNDGPVGDHEVTRDEHGYYRVNDPEAGEWLVEKGDEDPMDIVSFRWYPLASDELPEDASTSIEISLSEEGSGIAVHVEESGFSAIAEDDASARSICEDELAMWEVALAAVKAHLEA
ncbi:hypothetical protein [Schaalia cardiffensis]|uniref:Toxin n=1 Tax=Schaalia cardiffensis F0333 TaxID=888050 RepID=N6XAX0_9ACTO|nr:hypothetical protein [Schaalia cardiffensis]ENO18293.1 hypothetical protein HMPREF9004_0862 [Schaalia cardiffensis F0333]